MPRPSWRSACDVLPALIPGVLLVVFSFQSGGYFPAATALASIGFVLALVVRITTVKRPVAGLSAAWLAGAALIALFAMWTLASGAWSDAPARALIEYDRALLYLLTFLAFGAIGRTPQRLRWLLRGLALGAVAVCVCSITTKLAPDVWTVTDARDAERLSYPLTYWNTLGLLAALGCVFCFGLTTDAREPPPGRVLAAAAMPLLGATLMLTLSRGSIVAGLIGVAAVLVVARPGLVISGLIAVGPALGVAIAATLRSDLAGSATSAANAANVADGHRLAATVAACCGAAAVLRILLLKLDPLLERLRAPSRLRRKAVVLPAVLAASAFAAAAFLLLGGPDATERQIDRFTAGDTIAEQGEQRLTSVGNNGRLDQWRVALDVFQEQPLRGSGAGTSPLEWEQRRPLRLQVEDGHSLYIEVLGELGIVGLVLVVGAVLLILGGLAFRARGPQRGPAGALFAAVLAWALHAGVDWDWEMPAVTLWVFAAGGMALAATRRPADAVSPADGPLAAGAGDRSLPRVARVALGFACLFLVFTPLSLLRSDGPLRDAQEAFARGDCRTAIDKALTSSAAMGSRPEPYLIVGYCDTRAGYGDLAIKALDKAVARDPDNWEYRYGRALVRAAAGKDPRPAARQALRLNPQDKLARKAVRRFATDSPAAWRRRALVARLPID